MHLHLLIIINNIYHMSDLNKKNYYEMYRVKHAVFVYENEAKEYLEMINITPKNCLNSLF